jgi:hypothetical protein
MNRLDYLENSAFDSLDGDTYSPDTYSPDFATGMDYADGDSATGMDYARGKKTPMRSPMPSRPLTTTPQSTFTITITSTETSGTTLTQLFQYENSVFRVKDTGVSANNPFTLNKIALATGTPNTVVLTACNYFDELGNGIIQTGSDVTKRVVISCQETSYRSLIESLTYRRFYIDKVKFAFLQSVSLGYQWNLVQKNIYGLQKYNPLTPQQYFSDNQFQIKQVTFPIEKIMDFQTGFNIPVLYGETLQIVFYVKPC